MDRPAPQGFAPGRLTLLHLGLHLVEAPSKVAAGLVDGQPPGASATKHSYFDSSRNSAFVTAELALLGNKLFAQADGIEVDVALNKTGV